MSEAKRMKKKKTEGERDECKGVLRIWQVIVDMIQNVRFYQGLKLASAIGVGIYG